MRNSRLFYRIFPPFAGIVIPIFVYILILISKIPDTISAFFNAYSSGYLLLAGGAFFLCFQLPSKYRWTAGFAVTLALFGLDENAAGVKRFRLDRTRVPYGGELGFSFELVPHGALPVRVEYAVYFLKKSGRHTRKVFKIAEASYTKKKVFRRRHAFRDLSTRKHHPGVHYIAVVVNGREEPRKRVVLLEATAGSDG